MNVNLARWTRIVLDGHTIFDRYDGQSAQEQIRRTAIVNLKKVAGSGTADYAAAAVQAWRDRDFIRKQVGLIRPTAVVAGGIPANRIFRWIMTNDLFTPFEDWVGWTHDEFAVVPANHPSLRPKDAPAAFERIVEAVREAKLGAFG